MKHPSPAIVYLPGAGGGAPDLSVFRADADMTRLDTVGYPGWRRYVAADFSAQVLVAELANQIAARVPCGPIRIIGMSIGGHFGYAAALHLQAAGREIAGFCAIDSFMINSSEPAVGWKGRALAQGLYLLRRRRLGEFVRFARSKVWRALLRLPRERLPNLLRGSGSFDWLPLVLAFDPLFEEELSMRMLLRLTASWIASLDSEPIALKAPAALLRPRLAAGADAAWRRRCPNICIYEVSGGHHTLFEPENIDSLHHAFITATREWF